MKAYELLYINRNTLRIMSEMSLDASDIKYLEMYKDYTCLTAEGHKRHISCSTWQMNTAFQKGPSIESLTGCPLTFQFNKGEDYSSLIFLLTKRVSAIVF